MSNTPRTDAIEAALMDAQAAGMIWLRSEADGRVAAGMILGALADRPAIEAPVIVWTRQPEAPPPDESETVDDELVYTCRTCSAEYGGIMRLSTHVYEEHGRRSLSIAERTSRPRATPPTKKKDTAP